MPDESRSLDQYTIAAWQNGISTNRNLDQYAFIVWTPVEAGTGAAVTWTGQTRARAFTGRWRKKQ